VWTSLALGVVLAGLTPPFQVPDEPNHLFRAYQVAEGRLAAERIGTSVGGVLPRSLPGVATSVMGNVPFNPEVRQDLGAWAAAFDVPLAPGERIEVAFANTALSGPSAYLPQAIGISIARVMETSALTVLYAGRAASLLLCIALTALAIRWLPARQWTCVLLSLLPMTMFVRSSVSSDGPTLALAMLAVAICFRLAARGPGTVGPRDARGLFAVAALLALGKPPYSMVALLAVALPGELFRSRRDRIVTLLVLVTLVAALQGAWLLAMRERTVAWSPGADPKAQMARLAGNPVGSAAFLAADFVRSAPVLAHQAIGVLGWLDAPIEHPIPLLLALLLLLVALGEPAQARCTGLRSLAAAIFVIGAAALQAMNYAYWTPPDAVRVAGLQGRHLLPFAPLLLLSIAVPARIAQPIARLRACFVVAFIALGAAATVLTLIDRYSLLPGAR
jgi:uncharacterized membrane protein